MDQKNDIIVIARCGLNNKLRVLLSYLFKANKENKKLKIIWHVYDQCPDRFDNLFQPIDNVEISYVYTLKNLIYDYSEWKEENRNYIHEKYYSLLKPLPNIREKINECIKQLGESYIACHIRRTDALTNCYYKNHMLTDDEYIKFINQHSKHLKIYVATDCWKTQEKFIDLYKDRMIFKKIEYNIQSDSDLKVLRQTSLEDAVKDMYVCAGATYFMRSYGSFSDSINYLRNL